MKYSSVDLARQVSKSIIDGCTKEAYKSYRAFNWVDTEAHGKQLFVYRVQGELMTFWKMLIFMSPEEIQSKEGYELWNVLAETIEEVIDNLNYNNLPNLENIIFGYDVAILKRDQYAPRLN